MRSPLLCALALLLGDLTAQAPPALSLDPLTALVAAIRSRLGGDAASQVRFDRPATDGPLWALGSGWKASFDAHGATVIPFFGSTAPRNFPLRLELAKATVGGAPLTLRTGEPIVDGTSVRTDRGALTEVFATSLDSLEHSFVFDELPGRGAIAVEVRMQSELGATSIENGVRFANEYGHVDYTKAIAVDARGESLPLAITWTGTGVRMEIPAAFVAEAQLPLVLDPVLNGWFLLGSGTTQLQHDSDVASFQALGGRTLLVWQRQWSATDQDCFGLMFDGNLGLVQTDFAIDFTSQDWTKVAVASNAHAQNFLVVAEIRIGVLVGSLYYIGGRGVASDATMGAVFDIERDGVIGSGGNNFHPDVGGDPYLGPGRYTVVFQKVGGPGSGIYMKQVTSAYGAVTSSPIALDTSVGPLSRPSIGKSCGQSNGLNAYWLVNWERTYAGTDQDVHGRYVNWNGALPGASFQIATTGANETAPSAGSPIELNGVRYWPVAYEFATAAGTPRDVHARLYRFDGGFQAAFTVSDNVPGADDRSPEIDSDGTRFVATFTTGTAGYPQSPQAVTVAFLPATNSFRVEERTGMGTSSLDEYGECNVCADFSGGSTTSPHYFVSFTARSTNTFDLKKFGGWVPGTPFTTRSNQCGSLSIAASGNPVIGQNVVIAVGSAPLSGTILGFPGNIPLQVLGCNCSQGVDQGLYLGNPLVWNVPNNPVYVGITLSVQGWTIAGSQCLGFVDLSDTVDFTIR